MRHRVRRLPLLRRRLLRLLRLLRSRRRRARGKLRRAPFFFVRDSASERIAAADSSESWLPASCPRWHLELGCERRSAKAPGHSALLPALCTTVYVACPPYRHPPCPPSQPPPEGGGVRPCWLIRQVWVECGIEVRERRAGLLQWWSGNGAGLKARAVRCTGGKLSRRDERRWQARGRGTNGSNPAAGTAPSQQPLHHWFAREGFKHQRGGLGGWGLTCPWSIRVSTCREHSR
jgi:hypothetical protein